MEFGAEWARYIEGHPVELSVQVDDSGRGTVSVVRYQPPPHRLSLLVGEFLYELRAALDNCLYETAVQYSGQDPPPGEGLLQFPIYDTAESWTRNLYRLKHLSDEHRAMLERIQPYQAQRQNLNCLRILNRLARNDRHRTLHVVGSVLANGAMLVEAPPGSKVIVRTRWIASSSATGSRRSHRSRSSLGRRGKRLKCSRRSSWRSRSPK
jgi:hypothetical protein